jgi:DNA mismatch repair protein MutL
MPIQQLTSETIGKIAAGEVVERPSSVVKELIENSIDAGASRLSVEIQDGGGTLIRVSDDGSGMSLDDLAVAILRHATSKLSGFDDLESLLTLGFRGEALPSIGAVSSLEVRSATRGSSTGGLIGLEYGATIGPRVEAVPAGTTVTVSDLFGNVPARRKFLRQPSTEASYISRLIGAYACNRSDIRWSLVNDGRRVLTTSGTGDDLDAAIGVFGAELADEVLPLRSEGSESAVRDRERLGQQSPGDEVPPPKCLLFRQWTHGPASRANLRAGGSVPQSAHGRTAPDWDGQDRARSGPGRCQRPPDQGRGEIRR